MVACLLGLVGCESDHDTHWMKPRMDADVSDSDVPASDAGASDAGAPFDAAEFDGGVLPLVRVDCSAVMRDAGGERECQYDCFAVCAAWCSDPDSGCGDAAAWFPCASCNDSGVIVPTL